MEHSIEKYLERRTDQELEILLNMYIRQQDNEYYDDLVKLIHKIRQERNGGHNGTEASVWNIDGSSEGI